MRLAFEKTTGEDLSWFFNQWFFTPGHPNLEITKKYDPTRRELTVTVEQTQDIKNSTVFILPFRIDIYNSLNSKGQRHEVMMTEQKQSFTFSTGGEPVWVGVDAERVLLGKRKYKQTNEELINQYRLSKRYQDRYEALKYLRYSPNVRRVFEDAMKDDFWHIRQLAIDAISFEPNDDLIISQLVKVAKEDPRSHVRRAAIERIGGLKATKYLDICKDAVSQDQSYMVVSAAFVAINRTDSVSGIQYAEMLKNVDNTSLLLGVANIFEKTKERKYLSFYESKWDKTSNYARFSFLNSYAMLLTSINDKKLIREKNTLLSKSSMNKDVSQWGRYASTSAIKKLRENYFDETEVLYSAIVDKIKKTKGEDKKPALAAVKAMLKEKNNTTHQAAINEVKKLSGNSVESILNLVDEFAEPTLYDELNNAILEIKKWEKDPILAKLYESW